MPRYKLTIAYDGTDFCGWQKQEPPGNTDVAPGKVLSEGTSAASGEGRIELRTVQAVVERAVREVVREPVPLLGASRTDAGVHARGQVAAFSCGNEAWPLERGPEKLLRAINSRLPDDVLIVGAEPVPETFSPISDCTSKGYSYALHISADRALWDRRFVHHVWVPLDVERMNEAAAKIIGEHDFAAFAAAGHGRLSTIRRVFDCRIVSEPPSSEATTGACDTRRVRIDVSGNGFLWNMVRIIAGTLVDVGRGRMTPEDVGAAIQSKDRRNAGPTLPPTGLCLEWVRYDA